MQDDSDSSSLAAYLSEKNQSTTEELTTEQTRHVNLTSYLEDNNSSDACAEEVHRLSGAYLSGRSISNTTRQQVLRNQQDDNGNVRQEQLEHCV